MALNLALATPDKIETSILKTFEVGRTANIIVSMKEKTFPILNQINAQSFNSRAARVHHVANSLKALAGDSQKPVLAYLSTKDNIQITSLWVTNKIIVKGATTEIIESLVNMEEISSITEDRQIPLNNPAARKIVPAPKELQWGVERIQAPAVWEQGYSGQGVTVANIDTSVRYTHSSLNANFRNVRGWFDALSGNLEPFDSTGHGTHTMGTIVGANGVGVAPDATWIACRACDENCEESALLQCGQFMLCPTLPDGTEEDCDAAPHIVSNSWGSGGGQKFYDEVLAAWFAAGIIPVFSNGNHGLFCGSTTSPADSFDTPVIAVGATDINEERAFFSSLGPSAFDATIVKPDIAAPGVNVTSASFSGDDEFESMDGTSMACPHVAGALALLLSNGTELTYQGAAALLYVGASRTVFDSGMICGGIPDTRYPNNHVGWGRLSISNSIDGLHELLSKTSH